MKLKSPTLLRKQKIRGLIAVGAVFVGFSGLALAQTTPALADPTEQVVVVGSDTIQDIWNQFAINAGGNQIGSYNATNPVTNVQHETITPVDGHSGQNCSFVRPNGSGDGVGALRYALNNDALDANTGSGDATPVQLPGPTAGCVDIARSSSGPGATGGYTPPAGNDNAIDYVPFALDAVAGASGPEAGSAAIGTTFTGQYETTLGGATGQTVTVEKTNITDADSFTELNLKQLFNCQETTVAADGVTYWPNSYNPNSPQPNDGSKVIDLYIPQAGSGTEKFWASTLGFNATTPPTCDSQVIQVGELAPSNLPGFNPAPGATNYAVPVEEHDGTVYATDPNAFGPFSIAQWISQNNGHNPRTHGAVVHSLQACNLTAATCSGAFQTPTVVLNPITHATGLNTSFPITRQVFDVVSDARFNTTGDPVNLLLNGTSSTICSASGTIQSYGFATIGSLCGVPTAADIAQP